MGPAAWAVQTYTGHLPTTNPTSGKMAARAEADKGHEAQGRQEAERETKRERNTERAGERMRAERGERQVLMPQKAAESFRRRLQGAKSQSCLNH